MAPPSVPKAPTATPGSSSARRKAPPKTSDADVAVAEPKKRRGRPPKKPKDSQGAPQEVAATPKATSLQKVPRPILPARAPRIPDLPAPISEEAWEDLKSRLTSKVRLLVDNAVDALASLLDSPDDRTVLGAVKEIREWAQAAPSVPSGNRGTPSTVRAPIIALIQSFRGLGGLVGVPDADLEQLDVIRARYEVVPENGSGLSADLLRDLSKEQK